MAIRNRSDTAAAIAEAVSVPGRGGLSGRACRKSLHRSADCRLNGIAKCSVSTRSAPFESLWKKVSPFRPPSFALKYFRHKPWKRTGLVLEIVTQTASCLPIPGRLTVEHPGRSALQVSY